MEMRSFKDMKSHSFINEIPDDVLRERKKDKTFNLNDIHKGLTERAEDQISKAGSAIIEKTTIKCGNPISKRLRCHTIKQAQNFLGIINKPVEIKVEVEKKKVKPSTGREPKVWEKR